METMYLIAVIIWIILSIMVLVKFFQIANDIRALRNHFTPLSSSSNSNIHIAEKEEIKGVIRKNGGVDYSMTDGMVDFSDGKAGVIIYLKDNTYQVDGFPELYKDIYTAIEALYDHLSCNK